MKRLLWVAVLLAVLCSTAHAVPTIFAGDHIILPNTAGQVLPIFVLGPGEMVPGVDLHLLVNGGIGPAPLITDVDLTGPGTIFHANNTGQLDYGAPFVTPGLQPSAITTTTSGFVEADGILAYITVDTTGLPGGVYTLSLTHPLLGPSDFATDPGNDAILIDGTLGWLPSIPEPDVPEPSTFVLAAFALGGLFLAARRRRSGPRHR
ncbi:MAG: PEP-CTERM sorting domain-containing protein [Planctomycetota bacterium]|nr:MAG: PEP-CTERM sorting domain-containing protein [Planctomycetota bacterium]